MGKYSYTFFMLGCTVLILSGSTLGAQELSNSTMKTGLIYKFAQHIEWEQENEIDTFRIGIYGHEPGLMSDIVILESVTLKERPISIIHFSSLNEISKIHLLYFTNDKNNEIQRITNRIAGNPIARFYSYSCWPTHIISR